MQSSEKIKNQSDSLIDLLADQCADLEKLLALAREETQAVEDGKFLNILEIVSDRERIGQKLETSQRQIAEIRTKLGESDDVIRRNKMAAEVVEMARLTLQQDQKTKLFLSDARADSTRDLKKLEKRSRGTIAYLREKTKGLAYDRSF